MDLQTSERTPQLPCPQLARQGIAANIPLDIFVDNLSPYLRFDDIMALRRVNKHYFHLTHEPLIWKRFFQQLQISFPPIRPTFDYSAQSSDYEIEQIVSRAISIEDNWRKKRPVVASIATFDASLEVLDMKIIPGGKYLVASIGDERLFFISVFDLDHPTTPKLLFSYRIRGKAYQLQAKYMRYHDRPVVMIAYVCRASNEEGSGNHAASASGSNSHMLNCIHVDLSTLDLVADSYRNSAGLRNTRKLWPSLDNRFKQVIHTVRQPMKPTPQLSLYSRAGVAYVSIVREADPTTQEQDCIVIVNVEHPQKPWAVFCQPYTYPHVPNRQVNPLPHMKQWIKAVRHFPEQNSVLVWRTIRVDSDAGDEKHVHSIELVVLPDRNSGLEHKYFSTVPIAGHLVLLGDKVQSVYMTDDIWPYDEESNIYARDPSIPPPPISVFAETFNPRVIHHWHIWPSHGPAEDQIPYVYHPHGTTITAQMTHNAHPYTGHVLPGVCRSLIYATEQTSGRFVYLRRYTSPRFFARTNHLAHQTHRHTERHDYLGEPSAISAEIDLGPEAAARYREHGVGVAAWDQTIGRVCLTTCGGSVVQVVDFSHATPPDERFCERKVVASAGFASRKEEVEDACMPPKSKRARIDDA